MTRLLRTPRWIGFTALMLTVAAVCMGLGWWQFQRYHDAGGSFQNLGYTLNWPAFGAFAVYLWWRLLRDAAKPADDTGDSNDAEGHATKPLPAERADRVVAPRPAVDDESDPELAAYNRYLAELAQRSQQ